MNVAMRKMHSDDRILVLKPIEGARTLDSMGLLDRRLFTGEQKLHAIKDPFLWYLKYESGIVPQPLKQGFTSFSKLYNFCEDYFRRRGLNIVEVQDVHDDL